MTRGHSAILTYHSLDDTGSVISTPPALFERQMAFLAASRTPVVPLDETLRRPGSVAITFDDGFRNLLDHAIPTLQRHGFPATIFIVSDYCGRRNNWSTQPPGVPDLPLLSWRELSEMPSTIEVGAHTVTHPNLNRISPEECERELCTGKTEIEQRMGKPVRWLAYPYGASSPAVKVLAGRHFGLAVGTALRFLPSQPDCLDLPRIDTYYLSDRFRWIGC